MSEVIKCDWCGTTSRRGSLVNWWTVDPMGMRFSTATDPDSGERHFCSRACLGQWGMDDETAGLPVSKASHDE